jgi:hypothetical protein
MSSISKRTKGRNEPYIVQYLDHLGKRRTVRGFTDKGLTEEIAAKLESEARRTTGLVDATQDRIGIPYKNRDGVADFHASGRHSYITGLLSNGASLPVAMELARHSDIRMTMRYTHIGLDAQASAVASLPSTQPKPAPPC